MSREKSTETASLGRRLREVRGAIPIRDFSKALGVTSSYIYDLEGGKKIKISETLAELISTKFKVSKEWLLTGEGTGERRSLVPHAEAYDPEIAEILRLLNGHPQDKALVLKLLKGKRDVKEALEGFGVNNILKEEGT